MRYVDEICEHLKKKAENARGRIKEIMKESREQDRLFCPLPGQTIPLTAALAFPAVQGCALFPTDRQTLNWPAFDYDGKPAQTEGAYVQAAVIGSRINTDDYAAESRTLTAPDEKLQVRQTCRQYTRYPAQEYAVEVLNLSKTEPTAIISNFRSLKVALSVPELSQPVMLNVLRGSTCKATDFVPESFAIDAGKESVLTTSCGRSSNDYIPFLELNLDEKNGYLFAIGWSGSWKARFANTGKAVDVELGMERTNFRLLPGETVRQPSVLIFIRKNQSRREFKTLVHRFMLEHKVPRDSKGQIIPPILAVTSGGRKQNAEDDDRRPAVLRG